jgi:hypothetical protein
MRRWILAGLLVGIFQMPVFAADSLDKANFGTYWYGPERAPDSLKGHIVLWENWGYN